MLTSRAGNAQAIGQRLQKKLPYGGRAKRTRAFKKANSAMTVLFLLQVDRRENSKQDLTTTN